MSDRKICILMIYEVNDIKFVRISFSMDRVFNGKQSLKGNYSSTLNKTTSGYDSDAATSGSHFTKWDAATDCPQPQASESWR